MNEADPPRAASERVPLATIAREWGRIGCIGFGGPPAHIALLRRLCVTDRAWMDAAEFEDAIAATNLLPGPASTQLAIFCAWRLAGPIGAVIGGACFIVPGLVVILALSALFLAHDPPRWVLGAAAGSGSSVAAVALQASFGLIPASRRRIGSRPAEQVRWVGYASLGALAAMLVGPLLVVVIVACGLLEIAFRRWRVAVTDRLGISLAPLLVLSAVAVTASGLGALSFEAFKVGALSYGGGFVIIPLMQHDVVDTYHWMTGTQFLNAVALGQLTPGPVVQTVAVVGFAVDRVRGALLAALVAFSPSFCFILLGGRHFGALRTNRAVQSFLTGAGPASIGAIAGSSVPLALEIAHLWQLGVLGAALVWLVAMRRSVVVGLAGSGLIGSIGAIGGLPVGH